MIVADTNLVAYLLVDGARTGAARAAWARDPEWRLPPLWRSEFLNVLVTAERAAIITARQAHEAWIVATDLFRGAEVEPDGAGVLDIAIDHRISAYDAQFVAIGEQLGVPLVTGDRALARACPDRAILVESFIGQ